MQSHLNELNHADGADKPNDGRSKGGPGGAVYQAWCVGQTQER